MGRGKFSLARKDEELVGLVGKSGHKILARDWQYHHLLELEEKL